jgi:hypothetical protein
MSAIALTRDDGGTCGDDGGMRGAIGPLTVLPAPIIIIQ